MNDLFVIRRTIEFSEWFEGQNEKVKALVRSRFSRIQIYGHCGDFKYLVDGVLELLWKNGLRVYFNYGAKVITALIGGTKNGQKKDIKKAKAIILREGL